MLILHSALSLRHACRLGIDIDGYANPWQAAFASAVRVAFEQLACAWLHCLQLQRLLIITVLEMHPSASSR